MWAAGAVVFLGCGVGLVLGAAPATAALIATTTTVTLSATTAHPYQPFTATAEVTPAASAGTVTFTRSGATLCSDVGVDAGSASCTANITTTSAGAPVTATFTPTDATVSSASTGSSPKLSVTRWPVTLTATYSEPGSGTCLSREVKVKIVRANDGAKPAAGLPAPTGTVIVDDPASGGAKGPLSSSGTFAACVAFTADAPSVSYGGDTFFASAQGSATRVRSAVKPSHTRNGAPAPGSVGAEGPPAPTHTRNGAVGGLSDTGPSHIGALILSGGGSVFIGFALLAAGRRRRSVVGAPVD